MAATVPSIDTILHRYPMRLFAYDFPSLLEKAPEIEDEIQLDALMRLLQIVASDGWNVSGTIVRRGPETARLEFASDPFERSVQYHFTSIAPAPAVFHGEEKLNEFGNTQVISVVGPPSLAKSATAALPDMRRIFEAGYRALEEAFVSQYLRWRFSLLDEIYSIANAHLRIADREAFIGRYWFSVTDLKKNRFRYHFDRQAIERGIKWFKTHPDARICGFFGIANLILEEPDDGVFGADTFDTKPVRIDDRTMLLKLSNLPHVDSRLDFAVAERDIYGEDEMACIDIVTQDNVSLQLNCPVSGFADYEYALASAADDIRVRFIAHRSKHEKDLRQMENALNRLKTLRSNWVRDLSTEFAAKLAAEMLKPS